MTSEEHSLRLVMRPVVLYLALLVITGIVCIVGLAAMYLPVWRMDQAVGEYSGDGILTVTSRNVLNPGYRVDFEAFDLSKPYEAEYALEGLPRMDAPARVGLYFGEISDRVYGIRGGTLGVRVSAGERAVMEVDAPLDDWNFSDQIGITVTYFNFETQERSSFGLAELPESGPVTLSVRYAPPEDVEAQLRGHVRLQVGGYD